MLKSDVKREIKKLVKDSIIRKIDKYSSETEYKPFFEAIFTREQILTASIIHSFYTTFGMSIYEQIAKIIAEGAGYKAETQYDLKGEINSETERVILGIHHNLRSKKELPDEKNEFDEIKKSIKKGEERSDPDSRVDLYIRKPNGEEIYFDVTSVKPNKKEFVELKRKLLRWIALRLSVSKNAKVKTAIAMPYNPYYPEPYNRWTKENMYDKGQLLVGEDFWNFIAGEDIYDDLLSIFKEVGDELREKIKEVAKREMG